MFQKVENIVIVGGGTSAWFTAAFLSRNIDNVHVTLIDKEVGASVGVGEGTLLHFDRFLTKCGFTPDQWFDEIDATFKSGILFPNWGSKDNLVWHPFYLNTDYPEHDCSFYEAWTHNQNEDFHNLNAYWDTSIANDVDVDGLNHYAYHVDCGKLVAWIQKTIEPYITIIKSEVVNVNRDNNKVVSVDLKDDTNIKGDLFIDCTGFKQLLQTNPQRVDLTGRLFCDTAVAGHVPYKDKASELNPYVISEAVDHGWIWNIPVQSRIGSGLVFNRSITDIDTAKQYFCDYWDNRVTPDDLKVIDWTPYYLKNMWEGNVVAIGLSGGFIEPLESTGVAAITLAIYELAGRIRPGYFTDTDTQVFNTLMCAVYEDAIDFVNMHYAYTDFDTPFWQYVKETRLDSETYKWYKSVLENGEHMNNDGKGHMFGGANWHCWMLQIESKIAATKSVDSETAKIVLEKWKEYVSQSTAVPHLEAIDNYMLYINTGLEDD